jgi:diguanylate cyclase (GGDEF)-like protein
MADRETDRGQPTILNSPENGLKVLSRLAESGCQSKIEPVVSNEARIGYSYPDICNLLDCPPGDELELLESLAESGCLSREIFDKVDLCPYCLCNNLRLRRLCPYCRSSLIVKKEVIHHFRCGWVGIEDEAEQGTDLICPKCSKQVRHVGVDYERAAESYYCTTCKKIFAQPVEEFLSVPCGRQIPKDGTMIHPIHRYAITPVGAQAARKQSFDGVPLLKGIIEGQCNLYTRAYIEGRLSELINRYLRYRAGFSAALISIDQYPEWVKKKGHVTASHLIKLLSSVLKGETRGVDLQGLFGDHAFVLLLPQTDARGAMVFAGRYMNRIKSLTDPHLDGPPTVSISVAGCPEDGDDRETIISILEERLKQCGSQGGNTAVGPKQAAASFSHS